MDIEILCSDLLGPGGLRYLTPTANTSNKESQQKKKHTHTATRSDGQTKVMTNALIERELGGRKGKQTTAAWTPEAYAFWPGLWTIKANRRYTLSGSATPPPKNINCKSQDRPFLGHTCMVMWVKSPKLCIIIKFHYNRLFDRLNNVEKNVIRSLELRAECKNKANPLHRNSRNSQPLSGLVALYIYFGCFCFCFCFCFCTVMATKWNGATAANAIRECSAQKRQSQESQLDDGLFLHACPYWGFLVENA